MNDCFVFGYKYLPVEVCDATKASLLLLSTRNKAFAYFNYIYAFSHRLSLPLKKSFLNNFKKVLYFSSETIKSCSEIAISSHSFF